MPTTKLREFLDDQHVKYVTITHSPAFTAQEIAATAHIPGKELAKTVMVELDGHLAMAVLPASMKVNLERLKEAAGAEHVDLAREQAFRDQFPGCEVGAMPPFGTLYGLPTFVSKSLCQDDEIAFNAGTHTELVRMGFKDFERLEHPKVVGLGYGD